MSLDERREWVAEWFNDFVVNVDYADEETGVDNGIFAAFGITFDEEE